MNLLYLYGHFKLNKNEESEWRHILKERENIENTLHKRLLPVKFKWSVFSISTFCSVNKRNIFFKHFKLTLSRETALKWHTFLYIVQWASNIIGNRFVLQYRNSTKQVILRSTGTKLEQIVHWFCDNLQCLYFLPV